MIIRVNRSLPLAYENDIENAAKEIPYFYTPNTSYAESDPSFKHYAELTKNSNIVENGQFTHAILDHGKVLSELHGLIYPILYIFAEKANIVVNNITRIKINLLLRDRSLDSNNYNFPHSDRAGGDKAFLYYINQTDGDTFLFEEADDYKNIPSKFTLKDRVTPSKGTGVFFDCSRFHASSNPIINQHRFVINFNFT
jgi:hypothetical protein